MNNNMNNKIIQLNPKCILFSGILMLSYYLLPKHNLVIYNIYLPLFVSIFIVLYYFLYVCLNDNYVLLLIIIASVTILLQQVYWNVERGVWSMYLILFIYGYIAMAFFDYYMKCRVPLLAGRFSITRIFKPDVLNR